MRAYDHKTLEKKWQKTWEESGIFRAENDSKKRKDYLLIEFPYPSGDGLHVGHIRSWTALDIVARKRRAEGKNVLYPIGWDAFGLPTENYAIKTGKDPRVVTKENTNNFRRQIKSLGISFDWSREINTTDPAYYKWTQWIFIQLFKKGLAYKAKTLVNWCPKDKIVLANEEVVDGRCERCGTVVEKREKEQWMLAITKYAQRLYDDLDEVDYIHAAKVGQRNWIGPSEGAEIDFAIARSDKKIKIFTTRPDTLFGATYLVLSPEHMLVPKLAEKSKNTKEVLAYVEAAKKKAEIERTSEGKNKTGVEIKGIRAINPANKEEIPVFVADYVLAGYGTGVIMAVPAHDERDFKFAKQYDLPIKNVVSKMYVMTGEDAERGNAETMQRRIVDAVIKDKDNNFYLIKELGQIHFAGGGVDDGESEIEALRREIVEETGFIDFEIGRRITPEIGCWGFRHTKKKNQRTVGPGYEIILNSLKREKSEIDEGKHELVKLPQNEVEASISWEHHRFLFERYTAGEAPYLGSGSLVNSGNFDGRDSEKAKKEIAEFVGGKWVTTYRLRDWVFSRQRYWGEPIPMIHCEKDGWVPVLENQLPVVLPEIKKYQPTDTGESPLANIQEFVDTVCPTCGGPAKRETDVMPNWAGSSWYYLRYADPHNDKEFAAQEKLTYWTPVDWYNGGMEHTTLHLLYSRFWHKALFDLKLVPTTEPYAKRTSHGLILAEDGSKMSKSKGNVINPDVLVEQVGADSLRLFEMFLGPFDQSVSWNTDSIAGVRRFLERVWALQEKIADVAVDEKTETLLNQTIDKVSRDIETLKMNTAVSSLMIFSNHLAELVHIPKPAFETFITLLAPFAPHMAYEIAAGSIGPWPIADASKLIQATARIAVQINGRVRATIELASGSSESDALAAARADKAVAEWLKKGKEKKAVYVAGKIINFVLDMI